MRLEHILGHKKNLNKFKWTELVQNMFSDQVKLYKKEKNMRSEKPPDIWKLISTTWVTYNPLN